MRPILLLLFALLLTAPLPAADPLQVSDNGHYLQYADGRPFFYLGDTAWELFHRLNREEADIYLEDRAAKGFTVIQAVALPQIGNLGEPNAYGDLPLIGRDPARPNEAYFEHVDYIVDRAAELGLHIGFLPTWGSYWRRFERQPPYLFNEENARAYGRFLGERYRDKPVIWILGGDENIRREDERAVIDAMATGLTEGDGGTHLITFHPRGPGLSSEFLAGAEWLDFHMYQSSHAAHDHDNGLFAQHDYALRPPKPTIDGEPRYERIRVGFYFQGANRLDHFDAYDVRQAAYWSVLAGACGHTYGHNSIWQMWAPGREPVLGADVPWNEALDHPGAFQMGILRRLFESKGFHKLVPDQSLIATGPDSGGAKIRAARAADGSLAIIYSPRGEQFTIDKRKLSGDRINETWFDPRYGVSHLIHGSDTKGIQTYTPPTSGRGNDWLLLLERADPGAATSADRPRLLVLTDIGGDPDDMQSMRRLMLYSNEFEIAGLIASASGTPNELGRSVVQPDLIRDIVRDYAAVRDNLTRHAGGYPTAAYLESVISHGSAHRGVPHLGPGKSTPGSERIIAAVDASDRPLNVTIWGGAHELAQALSDVRTRRTPSQVLSFLRKLRVYAIADQDAWGDAKGTGEWIHEEFPLLRYYEAGPPGRNRFTALFRGMYQNDSVGGGLPEVQLVRDDVIPLDQREWVEASVRQNHGPLGEGYPMVNQNPKSPNNTAGVKEGDTPSWFYFLPNGLSDPEHPEWGGWGGRFEPKGGRGHYVDAEDEHWSGSADPGVRRKWTVARWREAYQADFAARMDWCVTGRFEDANHNPVVVLNGERGREVVEVTADPGDVVKLTAAGTTDPDGDTLTHRWFLYPEAGTLVVTPGLEGATTPEVRFTASEVVAPGELHIICEVTDDGDPALRGYRRAVVTVRPAQGR